MKGHSDVIPRLDVMTKVTELLLAKQKHLVKLLTVPPKQWDLSLSLVCLSLVFFLYVLPGITAA